MIITLSQAFQGTNFVLSKSSKSDSITMENFPDDGEASLFHLRAGLDHETVSLKARNMALQP